MSRLLASSGGIYTVFQRKRNRYKIQPILTTINSNSTKIAHSTHELLLIGINICCWFLNDSLSVLLIHNVFNTSSEQADITTTVSRKIALNRPKSLFTQKLHVFIYSITLSVGCFTENVQNDRLSQPHKSEDVDATV